MEFKHISVLFGESIDALNIKPNGIYADGTLGGGGHSHGILSGTNIRISAFIPLISPLYSTKPGRTVIEKFSAFSKNSVFTPSFDM